MSVQVFQPFEIFYDINGRPLDDGFIWVGQPNLDPETNQISVFFDEALTIPATQPIRTRNGFPANAGIQAQIFVAETTFSITIKNKNSTIIRAVAAVHSSSDLEGRLRDAVNPLNGSAIIGHNGSNVASALNARPTTTEVVDFVADEIDTHNHNASAHPELSAFITAEADRAELAADAALIQAGVYVDEPTGRAAVADGQAFKVQGSGDIAAFEYRRVNASSSVLIATYPSADSQFLSKELLLDSGYAWAIVDSEDKVSVSISPDGTFKAEKQLLADGVVTVASLDAELGALTPKTLDTETGYAFVITDSQDAIAIGVLTDGTVVGNFETEIPESVLKFTTPNPNLWCIGDSLTEGTGGQTAWPEQLPGKISPRSITKTATGGQISTQLAARAGGVYSQATITSDTIPASGPVTLTAISNRLLSSPALNAGTLSMPASLAGIDGVLLCTHDAGNNDNLDVYTFTRNAAGTSKYLAPKSPIVPLLSEKDFQTIIIFVGRNNLSTPDQIKTDITSIVEVQKPIEQRVLILTPPLGGNTTPGVSTGEGVGTATYDNCVEVEDWATSTYGDVVIKVRERMFQFNNGSADDLDDVSKGVVPRSLRVDTIHFTTVGHGHLADMVAEEINRRAW